MNKVFKSVWSEALGAWVAASELCRGRGKGGGKAARAVALVGLLTAIGSSGAFAGNGLALGSGADAANTTDIAFGSGASAASKTKDAIAIGDTAKSTNDYAIAIGGTVSTNAANSIVMGYNAGIDVNSKGTVFFGTNGGNVTASSNSFAFNPYGGNRTAGSSDSVNILGTVTSAPGGVAVGQNSYVSTTKSVAIGSNASVEGANSVALGADSTAVANNTVSVGNSVTQRRIVQVANGTGATDAVNVSQIQALMDSMGAGGSVDSDGKIHAPTYTVDGVSRTSVGSAISALDRGLANTVKYGGTKDEVTLEGANGTQIHNLAVGSNATDAVNFSQLTDAGLTTDSTGTVTNAFVAYTDKSKSTVSLGGADGTEVSNVAAGSKDMDAVNVKQLKDAGAIVDSGGNVTNAFVAYDGTTTDSVTLQGSNGTQIHKVAAGTAAQDAVNVKQLTDAGAIVDSTGAVTNAFVAYDGTTKDSVTLKGSNGTQIHKVAAGTAAQDAVNVKQLTDAGAIVDSTGAVTNAFVAYDGTTKDSVTLRGSNGTQIHKVAAGTAAQDAVNVKQLTDAGAIVDSTGAVTNAFVAYDGTTKDSVTLKGSNGTQIHKVAAGTADQDAVNVKQLTDAGAIVDSTGTVTNAFVAYDGTTKDSVTLLGTDGTQIHNVAAGIADKDAVNVKQLTDAGAIVDSSGAVTNAFVAYDGTTKDSVTLKGSNGTVIHNVANGEVSATSKDAINGSQLFEATQNIPAFADSVNYDSPAHDKIALVSTAGGDVTISGVAAGAMTATSNEAVNGAQLFAVDAKTNQNAADITNINKTIQNITSGGDAYVSQDPTTGVISIGGNTNGNEINVAGTSGARRISGVAAGSVAPASTDAVNGDQLYNTAASTAAALGGGAGVDGNGNITAPTYSVGGTDVHDVGTAIANLDGRTTANSDAIADVTAATKNAVSYDSDAHNKVTLGGTAAADGTDANAVQLTNVKAGELSANSTDAVNGAQLNATNARVDTFENVVNNISGTGSPFIAINSSVAASAAPTATGTDAVAIGANSHASGNNSVALGANSVADEDNTASVGSAGNERRVTNVAAGTNGTDAANMNQVNQLRNDVGQSITSLQRSAFGGVASAMAMPSLSPREPGKTVVAVGVANYKGYGAVGAGATYRSRDGAWLINGALSVTPHGDTGARAQVGYEF
ncbi:MAG TPA: ESPR-type extended signal peptide-containing protein [Caballeronia sp.]|nr:ESPR-type extended signal peptide-containing protein [Caballeronia sp.]